MKKSGVLHRIRPGLYAAGRYRVERLDGRWEISRRRASAGTYVLLDRVGTLAAARACLVRIKIGLFPFPEADPNEYACPDGDRCKDPACVAYAAAKRADRDGRSCGESA